mgnify:CR=1 FL=1
MKGDGATSIMVYGTPQVQALNQKLAEDKIPGTSPGFGIAASADGKRYPYLFPIAATYWSQGAGGDQFVKDKLGGSLEGKKIAYLFYDNPAGREPIPIIEDLQKIERIRAANLCRAAARGRDGRAGARHHPALPARLRDCPSVRPGAVGSDQGVQSATAIRCPKRWVWCGPQPRPISRRPAAGRSPKAITRCQFAGAGDDYPVRQEIKAMYKAQGKEPPKEMDDTVVYNRGILWAAVHVEAIRNALKANGGKQPTGEEVKKGFEQIHDFSLGGLVPPLKVTAADHEGGGWVQVFQVKGGKLVKETEWFRGYPEVVAQTVAKAE